MVAFRNILIALPTVSRSMKSGTAMTVARMVRALERNGISVDLHNIDSAEIVTARDMFANMVLHTPKWDGLFFIDSDMGFSPELALKMLAHGAEVAAAASPRRTLNLERFILAAQEEGDLARARARASDFTVLFDWAGKRSPDAVTDGFCNAAAAGMAIALISRTALEAMVQAKVVEPRLDLNASGGGTCWSFFGILENDGHRIGEDYSFCYRWTKLMGRELHVCIDEEVQHIGDYEYSARFADLL